MARVRSGYPLVVGCLQHPGHLQGRLHPRALAEPVRRGEVKSRPALFRGLYFLRGIKHRNGKHNERNGEFTDWEVTTDYSLEQ